MMEWLTLGGHGGYVWGSYAIAALAIVIELVMLGARRRRALNDARLEARDGA